MPSHSTICFGVLFAIASTPALAQFYKGSELRQDLQLLSLVGTGKGTSEDYAKMGRLLGYIDGFVDAHLLDKSRGVRAPSDLYSFCLPANFENQDINDSVKSYLSRHKEPFIDQAPASAIVARALRDAFPCPKK